MGAKALTTLSREELDQTFLAILIEQCTAATSEAAACTNSIFTLTSNYIDQPEFDTLQQFYDLYFKSGGDVDQKKDAVNEEVDDLFEQLQGQMERGEELTAPEEDEEKRQARLSLAAIQKKLESLITLDGGIRDQILPALTSMQFEDAARQRIEHIVLCWTTLIQSKDSAEWDKLLREMAQKMSSVEESKDFYKIVLNEEAPEGFASRSVLIEF